MNICHCQMDVQTAKQLKAWPKALGRFRCARCGGTIMVDPPDIMGVCAKCGEEFVAWLSDAGPSDKSVCPQCIEEAKNE